MNNSEQCNNWNAQLWNHGGEGWNSWRGYEEWEDPTGREARREEWEQERGEWTNSERHQHEEKQDQCYDDGEEKEVGDEGVEGEERNDPGQYPNGEGQGQEYDGGEFQNVGKEDPCQDYNDNGEQEWADENAEFGGEGGAHDEHGEEECTGVNYGAEECSNHGEHQHFDHDNEGEIADWHDYSGEVEYQENDGDENWYAEAEEGHWEAPDDEHEEEW